MPNTSADEARAFFESLKSHGLGRNEFPETIKSWGPDDILNFIERIQGEIPAADTEATAGKYRFVASRSLGGGPEPCAGADCRIPHVRRLASFAGLYADEVHVDCPLERYDPNVTPSNLLVRRHAIESDLTVLYELQPLLEEGIVVFTRSGFSPSEVDVDQVGTEMEEMAALMESAIQELHDELTNRTTVFVESSYDHLFVRIVGPEDIVPHGSLSTPAEHLSAVIDDTPDPGTQVEVPEGTDIHDWVIHHHVSRLSSELIWLNWYADRNELNYLSDSQIHLRVLDKLNEPEEKRLTQALLGAFSHRLPTLLSTHAEDIVRLRREEAEAFKVYRDALAQSIEELRDNDPGEADEIFDDIVRPELNRIDKAVRDRRERMTNSLGRDVVYGAGFISLGLVSGIVPPGYAGMAGLAGGMRVLRKISELLGEPEEVRSSRYYFLWRAQEQLGAEGD